MSRWLIIVLGVAALAGCAWVPYPLPGSERSVDGHTSRNALDWAGTYQALLPCADCEGILATLTLAENGSYELKRLYVGSDSSLFDSRGLFSWSDDGRRIQLDIGDAPSIYVVQENRLQQLDMEGAPVSGALAERYFLYKVEDPDPLITPVSFPLYDTRWELSTLRGQELPAELQEKPWLILKRDGSVSGFAGCNSFTGRYTNEGLRLQFDGLASTLRACLEPARNDALLEVLRMVDNYSRSSNTLSLNRARMAPLAQFGARVAP
jgi:copper homeostasis protein (lipoprotein)